jgi:hypothetical protein
MALLYSVYAETFVQAARQSGPVRFARRTQSRLKSVPVARLDDICWDSLNGPQKLLCGAVGEGRRCGQGGGIGQDGRRAARSSGVARGERSFRRQGEPSLRCYTGFR